jgi:EAL and modified HD-GYP domain-containing signal transduction protein
MNAPDRLAIGTALGALAMSYAPLVDRMRRAFGTRLTMVSVTPPQRPPVGLMLEPLSAFGWAGNAPLLVAPLDAELDDSLLAWNAPANAVLEIPAVALRDPDVQGLVQRARRHGVRLAMRGCPGVPLPPALLGCFEFVLIHVTEDRRLRDDGTIVPPPPGVCRTVSFIVTGVFRRAELESAYERGAIGSVGAPIDEAGPTVERPPQPSQSAVLGLLRLAHERADPERMEALVRCDPPLMFDLLRFVGRSDADAPPHHSSVRRALTALDHAGLARWLSRVLRFASPDGHAAPLIHTALRRALFLEHLAGCSPSGEPPPESLFLTGAFSLLERTTGTPFDRLLQRAALPAGVAEALIARSGPCAPYLGLVEAIERSDLIGIEQYRRSIGVTALDCNVALLRALAAAPAGEIEVSSAV